MKIRKTLCITSLFLCSFTPCILGTKHETQAPSKTKGKKLLSLNTLKPVDSSMAQMITAGMKESSKSLSMHQIDSAPCESIDEFNCLIPLYTESSATPLSCADSLDSNFCLTDLDNDIPNISPCKRSGYLSIIKEFVCTVFGRVDPSVLHEIVEEDKKRAKAFQIEERKAAREAKIKPFPRIDANKPEIDRLCSLTEKESAILVQEYMKDLNVLSYISKIKISDKKYHRSDHISGKKYHRSDKKYPFIEDIVLRKVQYMKDKDILNKILSKKVSDQMKAYGYMYAEMLSFLKILGGYINHRLFDALILPTLESVSPCSIFSSIATVNQAMIQEIVKKSTDAINSAFYNRDIHILTKFVITYIKVKGFISDIKASDGPNNSQTEYIVHTIDTLQAIDAIFLCRADPSITIEELSSIQPITETVCYLIKMNQIRDTSTDISLSKISKISKDTISPEKMLLRLSIEVAQKHPVQMKKMYVDGVLNLNSLLLSIKEHKKKEIDKKIFDTGITKKETAISPILIHCNCAYIYSSMILQFLYEFIDSYYTYTLPSVVDCLNTLSTASIELLSSNSHKKVFEIKRDLLKDYALLIISTYTTEADKTTTYLKRLYDTEQPTYPFGLVRLIYDKEVFDPTSESPLTNLLALAISNIIVHSNVHPCIVQDAFQDPACREELYENFEQNQQGKEDRRKDLSPSNPAVDSTPGLCLSEDASNTAESYLGTDTMYIRQSTRSFILPAMEFVWMVEKSSKYFCPFIKDTASLVNKALSRMEDQISSVERPDKAVRVKPSHSKEKYSQFRKKVSNDFMKVCEVVSLVPDTKETKRDQKQGKVTE